MLPGKSNVIEHARQREGQNRAQKRHGPIEGDDSQAAPREEAKGRIVPLAGRDRHHESADDEEHIDTSAADAGAHGVLKARKLPSVMEDDKKGGYRPQIL